MAMFGQPKGDIICIRYHIRERKCGLIASNIAQAGLRRVGFCSAEISNHLFLDSFFPSDTRKSAEVSIGRVNRRVFSYFQARWALCL